MFFYLFGIGVCMLLPLAAYLFLGRGKQPIERQQLQPIVWQDTGGQRHKRQLGRAVVGEERVINSGARGNTPRRLSFGSAVKMTDTPSVRPRNVPSLKQQMLTGSLLSSPRGVTKLTNQTGGGLVDYVTKSRLRKDQELVKSPVMVRVRPAAPPPVRQMNKELNPTDREMVLSALKQKTRRKRAISPDDILSDDKLVSAAKRKRPPESVSHGTKRQAGNEDTENFAKRSRNISNAAKDTERTDKGQKRVASPPTASVNKRPVLHQDKEKQTNTKSSRKNRLVLDDDITMHDVSTKTPKASQKRPRGTDSQHEKKAGAKSSVAKTEETRVEYKEKKQKRRKSTDENEHEVQVFESSIPVYSPGLPEGVALRRAVSLRTDPKAPLHLSSQLTKGKTYSKEDIEHDRQAAHSRVEYLLAEEEEEKESSKGNGKDEEVSADKTTVKHGSDPPRDEPDGGGTENNESVTDSIAKEKPSDSDGKEAEVAIREHEHKIEIPTSTSTGFKLAGNTGLKLKVDFKLPSPPQYSASQGNPPDQQSVKEQVLSQSALTASLSPPNTQTGLGSLNQPSSTEMSKPVLSMTPQMSQQSKPVSSNPLGLKPDKPVTCQPLPAYSQSTGNMGQLSSSGFSLSQGISFSSTVTPHTEKTTTVDGSGMVSPMSDDGGAMGHTETLSENTTAAGPTKLLFNLLPSIQMVKTAAKVQEAESPKLSFGTPSALQKEDGLTQEHEAAVPKFSFGLPSEQQKGGLPKVPFTFSSSGQLKTNQETQATSGGQGLSFQFKPSTPGGVKQPTGNSVLRGLSTQNQGSSFTLGGVTTIQRTQPPTFNFTLKSQDQQKASSETTFQFGSPAAGQSTQQDSIPVPSFGSRLSNQAATPDTFNFSLAAAGQQQMPGFQFGNQQTPSKPMFNVQSTPDFAANQTFGSNTPSLGFTMGSSLSASGKRPVAKARRRTHPNKPR